MNYSLKKNRVYIFEMPVIHSNMYVLVEGNRALIVDPVKNDDALKLLADNEVNEATVLLTHEHEDHIGGINKLRELVNTNVICTAVCAERIQSPEKNLAKYWTLMIMDRLEEERILGETMYDPGYRCYADTIIDDDSVLTWNNHEIKCKVAPGHSPGGALIFIDDVLFSGDNLVNGSGVIYRFPGGNKKDYLQITKPMIDELPDEMMVFPGHGEPDVLGNLREYTAFFDRSRR